jgi:hypothetical protein
LFSAGFVGPGMLSAAVAGAVFTSPPPASILAAIRAIGTDNPGMEFDFKKKKKKAVSALAFFQHSKFELSTIRKPQTLIGKGPDRQSALLQSKTCFSLCLCMFRVVIRTLYFTLRHFVFRFVFVDSVSATQNKTRKHEKQCVVSKHVFCLPSVIHFRSMKGIRKGIGRGQSFKGIFIFPPSIY